METLTYNCGETPADVIRGEFVRWFNLDDGADALYRLGIQTSDDLLTVLDALVMSGGLARTTDAGICEVATARESRRQLRIDILAALGIEES